MADSVRSLIASIQWIWWIHEFVHSWSVFTSDARAHTRDANCSGHCSASAVTSPDVLPIETHLSSIHCGRGDPLAAQWRLIVLTSQHNAPAQALYTTISARLFVVFSFVNQSRYNRLHWTSCTVYIGLLARAPLGLYYVVSVIQHFNGCKFKLALLHFCLEGKSLCSWWQKQNKWNRCSCWCMIRFGSGRCVSRVRRI